MADARRVYRLLLKLYPARFREEYQTPLERQFWDEYREVRGSRARTLFWLRALRDLATSIPAEILHELQQDLRYAARIYRRRSFATVLAFTALTLAIGATTGIFSVLNALLLRSLPFRDPERLVELQGSPVRGAKSRSAFYDWRDRSPYLKDAAAYSLAEMNLSLSHESVHVIVAQTSSNFFAMLGAEPALGRAFAADEDVEGRAAVAVIGHGLWQQFFGGDPRVLGTTIRLNGALVTVIGVAPPGFDYPGIIYPHKTALWTPTVFDGKRLPAPVAFSHDPIGRLKPGISLAQARAMFETEVRRVNPESLKIDARYRPGLIPLRDRLAGPVRQASLVLMGIVVFVLLIACANVAHLLLSRVAERRQELAIRAALGASRARLVQQLITESTVLTLAAAAAGMAVAHWASRLASAAQPAQLGTQEYTILDWRVLGFVVGVALLTGVVFGVLPAWLVGRMHPAQHPMRGQSPAHGAGVRRMRAALVVIEAAVTVVLVAGALSLGRSFLKLLGTDLGFRTDRLVTMNVSLTGTRHEAGHLARQYYREALDRLRALPGVESAGAVRNLPLTDNISTMTGFKLDPSQVVLTASAIPASPDYFRTIGLEVVEGREFTAADRQDSAPVAIVNQAFARRLGVSSGLVGRKLFSYWGRKEFTIVGVVRTARAAGPSRPGPEHFYFPVEQQPPWFITFVARVRGKAERYLAVCRKVVQQVDPQVPVYDVKTLDQRLSETLARPRFYTTAILFFGAFALLLAVAGIYGVAIYSIAQRTHEIGVRIAVGASPPRLRFLLLRQSLLPMAAGMAAGVAGAVGLGQFLKHLMTSAEPLGAWTSAAAALLLALTAALAVWTATGRIIEIDPVNALRAE